jgi:outer membrane protein assembly factor BamE
MKKLLIPIVFVAGVIVTGCAPYKLDVQQGNVIEQKDLNQVKPGMTTRQVQFLLGTPLIRDSFHPERWDYVYSFQPGGKKREEKRITLYFENDRLVRIEGDMKPQENAAAQGQDQPQQPEAQ